MIARKLKFSEIMYFFIRYNNKYLKNRLKKLCKEAPIQLWLWFFLPFFTIMDTEPFIGESESYLAGFFFKCVVSSICMTIVTMLIGITLWSITPVLISFLLLFLLGNVLLCVNVVRTDFSLGACFWWRHAFGDVIVGFCFSSFASLEVSLFYFRLFLIVLRELNSLRGSL